MIPKKLTIAGTYAFREETEIPLYADEGIVALSGDNGTGKTTILNAMHAAFYGTSPDRVSESGADGGSKVGTIYELFPFQNGMVDFEFAMGGRDFRIKRLVDGVRRKQFAYLWIDGRPVTEGKVREFEEAIYRETGLTEEFFLASVYACQSGKGAVNELGDKERRSLLDQVLGLSEFDQPLEWVSAEHRRVSDEIETLGKKLSAAPAADLAGLQKTLAERRATLSGGEKRIADAKAELADYQQRLADLRAGQQDVTDTRKRADLISREIRDIDGQIEERGKRISKNQKALDRRAEIEKAALELSEIEALLADQKSRSESLAEARKVAKDAEDKWRAKVRLKLDAARQRLESRRSAEAAHSKSISERQAALSLCESELEQAKRQGALLKDVPCSDQPALNTSCKLLAGARESAATIPDLEIRRADALQKLAEQQVAQIESVEDAESEVSALEADLSATDEDLARIEKEQDAVATEISRLEKLAAPLKPDAAILPDLKLADERIAEYREEIRTLEQQRAERARLLAEIENRLEDAGDDTAEKTLTAQADEARERIESLERQEKDAIAAIAKLEVEIDAAEKSERELAQVREQIATLKRRLAKVQVLREGLGPKGVRALRIDAAGPGISATVNELLEACYGTRFQVRIQTQRETAAGDLKEALRITVIDNEVGVESLVANKCGGEGALIGEALSLGLALYKRQQFGADLRTLIRDETTAPLSEKSGETYMRMLRRARELGGFHQVIYVTHKSSLVSEADAVIDLDGGRPVLRVAV